VELTGRLSSKKDTGEKETLSDEKEKEKSPPISILVRTQPGDEKKETNGKYPSIE